MGLILPGTAAANYASSPSITIGTGDIEYVARIQLDNYITSGLRQQLIGRSTSANISSYLSVIASGYLSLVWSSDGSTASIVDCTADPGFVGGTAYWVKVSRKALDGVCKFYMAADQVNEPTTWTQIGTDVVSGAGTDIYQGTSQIELGTRNNGVSNYSSGSILRGIIRNSPDGITLFDVDFTQQNDFTSSFTCTTGQTVTVTAANAVDTNDPYLAVKKAVNYVKTFASGGYFRTKNVDGDFLNGATELDARVAFSFDAVTNASASSILISKGASTPATASFRAYRAAATTNIRIEFSDGAAFISAGTVAMPTYAANEIVGLRITAIMGGNVSYQWKSNLTESNALDEISSNTGWTEFGTGSIAIASLTNPGSIGVSFLGYNSSSTSNTDGKVYAGWVSDDIDGSPDIKFSTNGVSETTIYNTVTGNECFLSRASSGRLTTFIEASKFLLATDDYLEILHNQLLNIGSEFDVLAVYRDWDTASSHVIAAKGDYNSSAVYTGGWYLRKAASTTNTYRFLITDGTISAQAIDSSYTQIPGELVVHAGGKYSTQTIRTKIKNNAEATYNGTPMPAFSGNTFNMFIGRLGTSASSYADIELYALYVYSRKLTDAEIAAGVQYWNAA